MAESDTIIPSISLWIAKGEVLLILCALHFRTLVLFSTIFKTNIALIQVFHLRGKYFIHNNPSNTDFKYQNIKKEFA